MQWQFQLFHPHSHTYRYLDRDGNCFRYCDFDCHGHRNSYFDCDRLRNGNSDPNGDGDCDSYGDGNPIGDSDGRRDSIFADLYSAHTWRGLYLYDQHDRAEFAGGANNAQRHHAFDR